MKSLLEPELVIDQCDVIASIPPVIERQNFDKKSLPFDKQNVQSHRSIGKKHPKKSSSSQIEKERLSQSKAKLNRQLHDEHRVYFARLKSECQTKFRVETVAANVIQRHVRGFIARRRMNPKKYGLLRESFEKKLSNDEMFAMVEEALRQSGVV
eukprot:scaffold4392_cov63-Cyclotella_meneghiniana.AAC.7